MRMILTAEKKLIKAKNLIMFDHPFFASILLRLELKIDTECETTYTNGKVIGFSEKFLNEITQAETIGALAHEILHVANKHHIRRNKRNADVWDQACDYAINDILITEGFKLPKGSLLDKKYSDQSAEYIYKIFKNKKDKEKNSQSGNGNQDQSETGQKPSWGEVRDYPGSPEEVREQDQELDIAVAQATNLSNAQGELSGGMKRHIENHLKPKANWKEILADFITEKARNDYNWNRPSRRYMNQGLYIPRLDNNDLGDIAVMFDTSGSVSGDEINQYGTELAQIFTAFPEKEIRVIYIDSKVKGTEVVSTSNLDNLSPVGGGGTNFRPGFDWLEKNDENPSAVIYFTDGECSEFPNEPACEVIWVLTRVNNYFEPPFGEVISLI